MSLELQRQIRVLELEVQILRANAEQNGIAMGALVKRLMERVERIEAETNVETTSALPGRKRRVRAEREEVEG